MPPQQLLRLRCSSSNSSSTTSTTSRPQPQPHRRRLMRCSCSILPSNELCTALDARQQPACSSSTQQQPAPPPLLLSTTRRDAVLAPVLGSLALQLVGCVAQPQPAAASKLGPTVDAAWESMGGGPADLTFPESWLGVWDVTSTLVAVELPLGADMLPPPNMAAVKRAQQEDLNKPMPMQVAFMRNATGKVVYDRRFNTAALLASYYSSNVDFAGRIQWAPDDPNSLKLTLPEGLIITSRVLRRSEQQMGDDRFETSEFLQQVFDDGAIGRQPRIKASQCYTKFKFRDEKAAEAAGGPAIVATQVVNDFLSPFDNNSSANYMAAGNKPITTYTYKMAFQRHHEAGHVASAMHTS